MKYMKTNIAYIPIAEARGITLKVDKNGMDMSCSTLAHSRAEAIRIILKIGKQKDCVSVEVVGKGQRVGND